MIGLLEDPSAPPGFAPAPLPGLAVSAPAEACLNSTLLGKASGAYTLALWLERTSYNITSQQPIPVEPVNATVTLPAGGGRGGAVAFGSARLFQLSVSGTVPVAEWGPPLPAALKIAVPDEVLLLELVPLAATVEVEPSE